MNYEFENDSYLNKLGFRKVYTGGHHMVYCNGTAHLTVQKHPVIIRLMHIYACDCHKYENKNV